MATLSFLDEAPMPEDMRHDEHAEIISHVLEGIPLKATRWRDPADDAHDCENWEHVAAVLVELHHLPVPADCKGEPILWRIMEKMLEVAAQRQELWPEKMPDMSIISEEICKARLVIEMRKCPVSLCSRLQAELIVRKTDNIQEIDRSLVWPNYRTCDVMKAGRLARQASGKSLEHFIDTYTGSMGQDRSAKDRSAKEHTAIMREVDYFEPLAWFEATCLFLALLQLKPREAFRWQTLALDRWEKYQATKDALLGNEAWEACLAWLG